MSLARTFIRGLVDLAWPPGCTFCGNALVDPPGDRPAICDECWVDLPVVGHDVCTKCGTPQGPHVGTVDSCANCPTDLGGITATVSVGRYVGRMTDPTAGTPADTRDMFDADWQADPERALFTPFRESMLRNAILRLKHRRGFDAAATLGRLLAGELIARDWAAGLHGIVPVPLHWRRYSERRFNQADELARVVATRLRLPVLPLLSRGRYTATQTTLPKLTRRSNVAGAFEAAGVGNLALAQWRLGKLTDARPLRMWSDAGDGKSRPTGSKAAPPLVGLRLLVLDDVMTTGATLAECARCLKRAGAASVYAAVVARV